VPRVRRATVDTMIDPRLRELPHGALLKYMTVEKLIEILSCLPDKTVLVSPNSVANLSLYRGKVDASAFAGIIDFAEERYEAFDTGTL
jgi:hypothetical protein